ncbi:MAG: GtrA family protein [bacterium]|nr:GtrA family protein [bacterium]
MKISDVEIFFGKYWKIVKYLISGGTAAMVNLVLLYILTDLFGVWYLTSGVIAFSAGFIVSFVFQKFWTFSDHRREVMHIQAGAYLVVGIVNLGLNTLFIYLLVTYAGFHYLWAQIVSGVVIACQSFFVYKHLIFFKKPTAMELESTLQ